MPRTVVPPVPLRGPSPHASVGGDGMPEKLVKYVPAETLAFFVPVAAGLGRHRNGLLVAALCAGVAGTVGYLWLAGQRAAPEQRPRRHFFVLAALAFLCWAAGTVGSVAALFRLDEIAAGFVLAAAVFLIPLLDGVLNRTRWRPPRRGRSPGGRARR